MPGRTTDEYVEAQPFNISFSRFGDVWSNVDPFPEDFTITAGNIGDEPQQTMMMDLFGLGEIH